MAINKIFYNNSEQHCGSSYAQCTLKLNIIQGLIYRMGYETAHYKIKKMRRTLLY